VFTTCTICLPGLGLHGERMNADLNPRSTLATRRAWMKAAASLVVAGRAQFSRAETGDAAAPWLGRWDLQFEREGGDVATVSLIERHADGRLLASTIGPNPIGLSLTQLQFNGQQARLSGSTALGPVQLELQIEARDRQAPQPAEGRWLLGGGQAAGRLVARQRADEKQLSWPDLFEATVTQLEAEIFDFQRLPPTWPEAVATARAAVKAAGSERELVLAVRNLLRASQLSHMGFYVRPGAGREAAVAIVSRLRMLVPGTGVLTISSFAEGLAYRTQLDAALASAGGLQRLLIDLRGNLGGSLNLAMRLGDHLFAERRAFGLFATRQGFKRLGVTSIEAVEAAQLPVFDGYSVDDFQAALQREGAVRLGAGGRAPHFAGPVAVLQNEACASTTEALLAVLKETGRARLFGLRTAGAMLSSAERPVANGYVLRLPYADFRTLQGRSLEGEGVRPDVELSKGLFGDRVQDAALAWLDQARRPA
jgi:hypothetical protein